MPALALHNPNEMGSGLYDVRASTPKSLSTTPTKPAKKLSNIPKHNLDKDVVKNNRPMQNLGDMKPLHHSLRNNLANRATTSS